MSAETRVLKIDPRDDVATALVALAPGARVAGVAVRDDIPAGHKIALRSICAGEPILKYGWPIGRATTAIEPGRHVHTHNLATALAGLEDYRYEPAPADPLPAEPGTFQGYRRADGLDVAKLLTVLIHWMSRYKEAQDFLLVLETRVLVPFRHRRKIVPWRCFRGRHSVKDAEQAALPCRSIAL